MIRRPPRSTRVRSSAASDVYKRQGMGRTSRSLLGDAVGDETRHGLTLGRIGVLALRKEHRQRDQRRVEAVIKLGLLFLKKLRDQLRRQQLGEGQTGRLRELALQRFDLADN